MYIHYTLFFHDNGSLWLGAIESKPEFEMLPYLFKDYAAIENYHELLLEINEIIEGRLPTNEPLILRDFNPTGDVNIYKDFTVISIEEEHKRLEIPTSDFKRLIENWIKFVEVNTAAFAKK